MKKQTILFSMGAVVLAAACISILPHLLDIVMFFLLAGVIPGTSHSVGAGWMFVISMGLFGFVVSHIVARRFVRQQESTKRKVPSFADNLPLKRFHQI